MGRTITHIVLHCTATIEGRDHDIAEVTQWHKARGFRTIGYHYLVKLDGTVRTGRPEASVGAHVEGYNANSIGIAYVGGLDRATKPKDTRTEKQRTSLQKLLKDLKARYPKAIILGHRDLSKDLNKDGIITPNEWMKACPCFNAKAEYKTL
jgi:N-acetylmuramoyl-L-alanine amidase